MTTVIEAQTQEESGAIRLRTRLVRTASAHLFGETARQSTLALVDQATVSGTRFLTTILIGRYCGPEELGTYSLAFSFVLVVCCVLESLIAMPYTIFGNRLHGRARTDYAGSSLVYCLALAGALTVGLALAAAVSRSPVLGALAVAILPLLLWQFARFASFAELHIFKAIVLDGTMAVLQLGGLLYLAKVDRLSAVWAYGAMTVACGISSVAWLYVSRRGVTIRWNQLVPSLRRNWRFARWLFGAQVIAALNYPVLLWLLRMMRGIEATGVFAACMMVLLICNPFLLGINSVLIPKFARAFAHGGRRAVQRLVWKSALVFGSAMSAVCLLIMAFGDLAIRLVFDSRYAGQWSTLALLGLTSVAMASGMTINDGLWAIERPDLSFRAGVLDATVAWLAGAILIPLWGVPGAACGLLGGSAASALARGVQFIYAAQATAAQGEAA